MPTPARTGASSPQAMRLYELRAQAVMALGLKDDIRLGAVCWLMRTAEVSEATMRETGLPLVTSDSRPWESCGCEPAIRELHARWTHLLHGQPLLDTAVEHPFMGHSVTDFADIVSGLERFLRAEGLHDPMLFYRVAAVQLALAGFDTGVSLEYLDVADCDDWLHAAHCKAIVERGVSMAQAVATKRMQKEEEDYDAEYGELQKMVGKIVDGRKEVQFYTAQGVDIGWAQHEKTMKSWNVAECGPAKKIARLAQAQAAGEPVQSALRHKSELVMMESGKYSLNALRSRVRSWCAFTTSVLGTEPHRSVPPVRSSDVLAWLAVFKVFGTALNYEAHLHKFCVLTGTSTA